MKPTLENTVEQYPPGLVSRYLQPKALEKWGNGRVYELLGVRLYKKFLPTGGDIVSRLLNYHPIIKKKNRAEALEHYSALTKMFEMIHTPACALMFYATARFIERQQWEHATRSLIANILVNVYPILVQRYNRTRINAILEQKNKK